jgi:hypothetical protein
MSRFDRIESAIESIQQTLEVQLKRAAPTQPDEIDLMRAKRRSS